MIYVFRNHTVEPFFQKGYMFSGYGDISIIPTEVESYVWFYQIPIQHSLEKAADEIVSYAEKFKYILSKISPSKTIVAFTIEWIYGIPLTDDNFQLKRSISEYNTFIKESSIFYHNLKVLDFNEFTRDYSVKNLINWKFYFISQMVLNPQLSKDFKAWFNRKLDSIALKRKKCLVLDLDNTLWGGVLGEDGIDGIQIGGDYPGKAFLFFQQALLELSKSGVLLAICSKNNEQDVQEVWDRNPFLVLKRENFVAYRINWSDKANNIVEIAKELNIGLDSIVFVDDNPSERELVRQLLPMVEVPDFPSQPYELPTFYEKLVKDYFKVYTITDEDRQKAQQYKENALRTQMQSSFDDISSFLRSLDLCLTIEKANEFNIQRVAQMTQKTNQFNLTTHRYTDTDIRKFLQEGWDIWCLSVSDKFGDSGITGCIMLKGDEIDSLLLSCRVLGKGIEFAFVKSIMKKYKKDGKREIRATYIPTIKNHQVSEFYENCGFLITNKSIDGSKQYILSLARADIKIEDFYKILFK